MADETFNYILELEKSLLEKDVRSSSSALEKLIHPDFMEIGSSGKVYTYRQIIDDLPKQKFESLILSDEKGRFLSRDLYLLNFTIERNQELTRRSSLWKLSLIHI